MDTTKIELREVESSGTLAAGEKALAELRKRKLVIQRLLKSSNVIQLSLTICKERANGLPCTKAPTLALRLQNQRLI